MKLGEVCLCTNDVIRLANFYKALLGTDNHSDDPVHQFILDGEVSLTVFNDGTPKSNINRSICLAFTVEDMDAAYQKVLSLGAEIIEPPLKRPWGAVNMSFFDPDRNIIYLRQFSE